MIPRRRVNGDHGGHPATPPREGELRGAQSRYEEPGFRWGGRGRPDRASGASLWAGRARAFPPHGFPCLGGGEVDWVTSQSRRQEGGQERLNIEEMTSNGIRRWKQLFKEIMEADVDCPFAGV